MVDLIFFSRGFFVFSLWAWVMVSEETPAGEAEATTKPLFNKIGYDNEVQIQQITLQFK